MITLEILSPPFGPLEVLSLDNAAIGFKGNRLKKIGPKTCPAIGSTFKLCELTYHLPIRQVNTNVLMQF